MHSLLALAASAAFGSGSQLTDRATGGSCLWFRSSSRSRSQFGRDRAGCTSGQLWLPLPRAEGRSLDRSSAGAFGRSRFSLAIGVRDLVHADRLQRRHAGIFEMLAWPALEWTAHLMEPQNRERLHGERHRRAPAFLRYDLAAFFEVRPSVADRRRPGARPFVPPALPQSVAQGGHLSPKLVPNSRRAAEYTSQPARLQDIWLPSRFSGSRRPSLRRWCSAVSATATKKPRFAAASSWSKSPLTDSNRRPPPYHGGALPTELRGRGR
jgi:hypothetical protein